MQLETSPDFAEVSGLPRVLEIVPLFSTYLLAPYVAKENRLRIRGLGPHYNFSISRLNIANTFCNSSIYLHVFI